MPSGLAAVTLPSLAILRPGDEVLVPDNVYGQNRYLTESWLPQWGVTHRFYDPLTVPELRDNTRLVWLEAAGSITLEFPDLLGTLAACRARGITDGAGQHLGRRPGLQRLRAGACYPPGPWAPTSSSKP